MTNDELTALFHSARSEAAAHFRETGQTGTGRDSLEFALRKVYEAGAAS